MTGSRDSSAPRHSNGHGHGHGHTTGDEPRTRVGDLIAPKPGHVQTGNPALSRRRNGPVKAFAPGHNHGHRQAFATSGTATVVRSGGEGKPHAVAITRLDQPLSQEEDEEPGATPGRPSECNPNAPMSKASTRASQMSAEFDASHEVGTDISKATPARPSVITGTARRGSGSSASAASTASPTGAVAVRARAGHGAGAATAWGSASNLAADGGTADPPPGAAQDAAVAGVVVAGQDVVAPGTDGVPPRATSRPQSAQPNSRTRYRPQSANHPSRFTPAQKQPIAGGGGYQLHQHGQGQGHGQHHSSGGSSGRSRPASAGVHRATHATGRPSSASRGRPGTATSSRQYARYKEQQAKTAAKTASAATSVNLVVTDGGTGSDKAKLQRIELEHRQRLQKYVSHKAYDGRSSTEFYKFGKVLGQGSFGKVRLAWHKLTGARVAVKSYEKERLKEPSHWRRTQQEIRLMERMNHPNIIRMLETLESPKRIHIVMEHAGGGNLCQYVKARKRLGEADARAIFVQVLMAVEYLHTTGIVHRDIKLENVLFDDNRSMKLVDFGFSVGCRDPTKKLKIFCGTPSYMAPEIVMRRQYEGRPVDIWSLGVLLYAMLCGMFPFVAKSYPELYKKIVRAQLRLPDFMSHAVKDLLRRMLHPDATKRVTVAQIRRHCWCATPVQALTRQLKHAADHSLLVSDCAEDDLFMAVVVKCGELGFNGDLVAKSVLSRARNHFSVTYYLLLFMYGRTKAAKRTQQYYMDHMPRMGDKIYCGPYSAALRRKLLFNESSSPHSRSPSPAGMASGRPARPSSAATTRPSPSRGVMRPSSATARRKARPSSAARQRGVPSQSQSPASAAPQQQPEHGEGVGVTSGEARDGAKPPMPATSTTSALSAGGKPPTAPATAAARGGGGGGGGKSEDVGLLDMMRYQAKPAGAAQSGGDDNGGAASADAPAAASGEPPNFDGVLDLMDNDGTTASRASSQG